MSDSPTLHAATFQALFETAPDAMIVSDAQGRIALANPQAERLFGYASGRMRGLAVEALVPEQVRDRHQKHRSNYVAQPRTRPMGTGQELIGQRADGSQFPVEIALSPIETPDGKFYVASIRDISETQRARQALVRARHDALVAQVGRIVLESSHATAFEQILELVAQELAIDTVAIVIAADDNAAIRVRSAIGLDAQLQEHLPALIASGLFVATAHSDLPAQARALLREAGCGDFVAAPLFDRGRPMGALIAAARAAQSFDRDKVYFLQSVANLIAASVQRSRSEEQLAHAQRLDAVGQLTGGIAHDFNNLLTVISGNLQLLEAELGDRPDSQQVLGSALRAVGRGAELTRKLLAFARRQRLNPQALAPRHTLEELIPILKRTLGETIAIELHCARDLSNVLVDPGELDTAILNLALNARDAMPRGGVLQIGAREQTIGAAEGTADLAPGDYVVISVRDSGLGMAPEVLARAFEPFFTTKETGRGSGLGLSMVYGFVKQSGGHLTADSRLGYGTRIELFLPAVRSPATSAHERAKAVVTGGKETVLVVEDEPEVRDVAIAFLHSLGYATYAAADAETALRLLDEHREIALLFSDVILGSGMDGGELALAARRRRPDLPTLLTSGYEKPLVHSEMKSLPLLRKPYRREELAAAVRLAMDGSIA